MSFDSLKDLVTSKAARQILLTQKHSPRILFVAGTVGVVAATVLACRATLKLDGALINYELAERLTKARKSEGHLSDEDMRKQEVQLKLRTAADIVKLYTPAVALGVVSIAALTGSHVIMTKRNGAVMAAYAGLDRAYKEYRQRVAQEYGKDFDRKFAIGAEDVLVEERLADGKTKTTKKVGGKLDGKFGGSPYAVVFDEFSKFFSREPGMNAMTIQMKQNYANDKLRANGHLFLNEVYDMLGIPRTKAGQHVGWVYRKDNEAKTGDNYVDFGVFDGDPEIAEGFIDGTQSRIVLDFNVDGIILDLI